MAPEHTPSDSESERESLSSWLGQPQTMIGLAAILLSLCGLFISLYEASLIRRQQRASAWPHVEVSPSLSANAVQSVCRTRASDRLASSRRR